MLLYALLTLSAYAQGSGPVGLVPPNCQAGCPCNLCDFYELARRIIDFLLFNLSVPIAAVAFLVGGIFLLTSAGNPGKITRGKSAMINAVIGLALAFFAWSIFNVILTTVTFKIGFGDQKFSDWFDPPDCNPGGGDVSQCLPALPPPPTGGGPTGPGGPDFSGSIDGTCIQDGFGTCEQAQQDLLNGRCPNSIGPLEEGCSWDDSQKYTEADRAAFDARLHENISDEEILRIASEYGVSPSRLKAIIAAESSANNNATHTDLDGETSYGLMQIRPDTARGLDPSLAGLSDEQIGERLRNPQYNVELGAKYYGDLLNKYSGDETKASAAYNGGPGANLPSQNCPGQLRWQCLWDNDEHTVANERPGHPGYGPTRKYIDNTNQLDLLFTG